MDAYRVDVQVLQPDGAPVARVRVAVLRYMGVDEIRPTWHVEQAPYTDEHGRCIVYTADPSLVRLEVQGSGLGGSEEVAWSPGQRLCRVTVQLSSLSDRAGLTLEVFDQSGVPLDGYQAKLLAAGDGEAISVLHSEDAGLGRTIWNLPEGDFELRLVPRTTGAPEFYELNQEPLRVALAEGEVCRARMEVHAGGRLRVLIPRRPHQGLEVDQRTYLEVRGSEDPDWRDMGSLTYGKHMVAEGAFPVGLRCYADLLFDEGWYSARIKGDPGSERQFKAQPGRLVDLEFF